MIQKAKHKPKSSIFILERFQDHQTYRRTLKICLRKKPKKILNKISKLNKIFCEKEFQGALPKKEVKKYKINPDVLEHLISETTDD